MSIVGEKGTYASIMQVHDNICKRKLLPCNNDKCLERMERQHLAEHVYFECPYTVIECKYKGIGCATALERKAMAAHEEDDKHHLRMALDTLNSLQYILKLLIDNSALKNPMCHTFALTEYHKKSETNEELFSHRSTVVLLMDTVCNW